MLRVNIEQYATTNGAMLCSEGTDTHRVPYLSPECLSTDLCLIGRDDRRYWIAGGGHGNNRWDKIMLEEMPVFAVSVNCGLYDGWHQDIATSSKERAFKKFRELSLEGFYDGVRILEWRDGIVRDILVESVAEPFDRKPRQYRGLFK